MGGTKTNPDLQSHAMSALNAIKLIFATQNEHKVKEIKHKLGDQFQVVSLIDLGYHEEVAETGKNLEDNAILKARHTYNTFGEDCFSEDTGLEVFSLDMKPGVNTARYAGAHKSATENMSLLLKNLDKHKNRKAQFRAVIALIYQGTEHLFEGISSGTIAKFPRGTEGFGYDPVFIPEGYDKTFAELDPAEKLKLSHRSRAFEQLVEFLRKKLD